MLRLKEYPKIKGFSLVELSVVLTIISITLAGALDLATRKTESDRWTETETRIAAIEKALQTYIINNQRLPCPADATVALSSSTFGVEKITAGPPAVCNSNFHIGTTSGVWSGGVPTKTLNLADKYFADDWDRRFTYVVDNRFANNYTTNSNCSSSICFKQATAGGITIKDSTGANITTEAVYVIISHGKNGNGAWTYAGSATRLAASSDTDETDNAGDDKAATFDANFVKKDTTTTFDDIVNYSTKSTLISNVGGITNSTTCTAASDAAPHDGSGATDPCPSASSTANCYALSDKVSNMCLQP